MIAGAWPSTSDRCPSPGSRTSPAGARAGPGRDRALSTGKSFRAPQVEAPCFAPWRLPALHSAAGALPSGCAAAREEGPHPRSGWWPAAAPAPSRTAVCSAGSGGSSSGQQLRMMRSCRPLAAACEAEVPGMAAARWPAMPSVTLTSAVPCRGRRHKGGCARAACKASRPIFPLCSVCVCVRERGRGCGKLVGGGCVSVHNTLPPTHAEQLDAARCGSANLVGWQAASGSLGHNCTLTAKCWSQGPSSQPPNPGFHGWMQPTQQPRKQAARLKDEGWACHVRESKATPRQAGQAHVLLMAPTHAQQRRLVEER
jgi:hypothetical protein